jgi:two-component system, chemotaxis family, chemotaxis protein CheY
MTPTCVLVVDDDLDIREIVQEILEAEGFKVATARDGNDALVYLASAPPPGLILLDLSMPIMDGATFCLRRAGDPRLAAIPVVVFSAAANIAERVRALDIAGYVRKPLRMDELLKTVATFCRPNLGL